ncbi:Tubulin-folding cofactor C [Diplonema papillatum]|nr:Tubulin-folding cofactor C [Diplonema papillatum]
MAAVVAATQMERMAARMEERELREKERKRDAQSAGNKLSQDVEVFDGMFYGQLKKRLDDRLSDGDVALAVDCFQQMQNLFRESCPFLPHWDRQRANEVLRDSLKAIDAKKGRKRFSFTRPTRPVSTLKTSDTVTALNAQPLRDGEEQAGNAARISNKAGETIVVDPTTSIFLSHLTDCKVFIQPVDGSVFIHHCIACTFVVAARQLRVHNTIDSSFYLHCSSEPIIEDCSSVAFAPYNWDLPNKKELIASTTLGDAVNKWDQVNDFKWLRAQHSPNWSIIPEDKQLHFSAERTAIASVDAQQPKPDPVPAPVSS